MLEAAWNGGMTDSGSRRARAAWAASLLAAAAGMAWYLPEAAIGASEGSGMKLLFLPALLLGAVLAALRFPRLDVRKVFFGMILLMPFIKGFSLKLGAQWEPYLVPAYILIFWALLNPPPGLNRFALYAAAGLLSLSVVSTAVTFLFVGLPPLDPSQEAQFIHPIVLSLVEHVRLVACLAVFVLVGHFVKDLDSLASAFRALSLSAAFSGVLMLYEFAVRLADLPLPMPGSFGQIQKDLDRTFGTFYEPTTAGDFMLVGLFATAIHGSLRGAERAWEKALPVPIFLGLITTFSLTAILSGALGYIAITLCSLGKIKAFLARAVGISLMASPLVIGYFTSELVAFQVDRKIESFTREESDVEAGMNFSQRTSAHFDQDHMNVPLANPLTGMGHGLAAIHHSNYPMFFRIPTEWGAAGTAIILCIGLAAFRGVLSLRRHARTAEAFPLALGMLVSMAAFLFNYNTLTDGWLWLVLGLCVAMPGIGGVREAPARAAIP